MIIVATFLGQKAVTEGNFFEKSPMIGIARTIGGNAQILTLKINFGNYKTDIFRSEEMNLDCSLSIVKQILSNPENYVNDF